MPVEISAELLEMLTHGRALHALLDRFAAADAGRDRAKGMENGDHLESDSIDISQIARHHSEGATLVRHDRCP